MGSYVWSFLKSVDLASTSEKQRTC